MGVPRLFRGGYRIRRDPCTISHLLDLDCSRSKEFDESDYINEHIQRFKHHDSLRQPVITDSVGKWKSEMSHAEAAVFEQVAGDLMTKHGYL